MSSGHSAIAIAVLSCFQRLSDPKQAYYAHEAREFLRKKLIGKHVKVRVDFVRPKEGEFDERECATVLIGNANKYANLPLLLLVAR